jgi:hypothetical protein
MEKIQRALQTSFDPDDTVPDTVPCAMISLIGNHLTTNRADCYGPRQGIRLGTTPSDFWNKSKLKKGEIFEY